MLCLLNTLDTKHSGNTSPHHDILLCCSSPSREPQPAQLFLSEQPPYTHFFPDYDGKKTATMFSPLLSLVVGNLSGTQQALCVTH